MRIKIITNFITLTAFCIAFFGCQKQDVEPESVLTANAETVQSNTLRKSPAEFVSGVYSVVGTRKFYFGPVSDSVLVIVEDMSAYSPKTISPDSLNFSKVTCDFASLGSSEWQYIIKLNPKRRTSTVEPNDVMLSQIMPGSFVTYASSYDPHLKQFYLKTGYVNIAGNGRIVEETLTLQSSLTGALPVSVMPATDK